MHLIIDGKEASNLNLFIHEGSEVLLKTRIMDEICKRDSNVVILCYQDPPQWYQIRLQNQERLTYFDGFSDPLNWNQEDKKTDIPAVIREITSKIKGSSVAIIDDVILFGHSLDLIDDSGCWDSVLEILLGLSRENSLFLFVNPKLTRGGVLRSLKYKSSFHATFTSTKTSHSQYKCQSILKKKSGKFVGDICSVRLASNGRLSFVRDEVSESISTDEEKADPTSNLTFNLSLTDSERQAKANTALPYIFKDENKTALLSESTNTGRPALSVGSGGGGNVIYIPDDVDDFDDEDPDDDLDI